MSFEPEPDLDPVLPDLAGSGLDCDQTQLMVEVPAISYFAIPTDGKGVLVWFHFLLSAGLLLTGYC